MLIHAYTILIQKNENPRQGVYQKLFYMVFSRPSTDNLSNIELYPVFCCPWNNLFETCPWHQDSE